MPEILRLNADINPLGTDLTLRYLDTAYNECHVEAECQSRSCCYTFCKLGRAGTVTGVRFGVAASGGWRAVA